MTLALNHHRQFNFNPLRQSHTCKRRVLALTDDASRTHRKPLLASFQRSSSTPCLSSAATCGAEVEIVGGHSVRIRSLVAKATEALVSGVEPVPASTGLGGAYYLRDSQGESVAVVKPAHEPLTPNATVGGSCSKLGETGMREVAAYLLDHAAFAGVPPTALVKISNSAPHLACSALPLPVIASLQQFVAHDFDAGDLGPSGFSVSAVHRIGILDVRLLNTDRHAGNILVKKQANASARFGCSALELVPIDHGLCLPDSLKDPYFEWLHWPQALLSFHEMEAEYIARLDPLEDADTLRTKLPMFSEASIRILVLCTVFLKRAASAGLCLADIGEMMTREFRGMEEGLSMLEKICLQAKDNLELVTKDVFQEEEGTTEEKDEEEELFQFDIEEREIWVDNKLYSKAKSTTTSLVGDIADHEILQDSQIQSPLHLPLRFSSLKSSCGHFNNVLPPLHERNDNNEDDNEDDDDGDGDDDDDGDGGGDELACLTKSVSVSVLNQWRRHETRDLGDRCISFGSMTEEEWGLFLGFFEDQLPEAFESRKNMRLMQRLGASCKF